MRPLEVHPPGVAGGADLPAELAGDALLDVPLNVILNHLTNRKQVFSCLDQSEASL